jgi:hypothetical protein
VDIDDAAADLLAQPLDQFTAARNARVKELKAAGKTDLAAQVAGLKKPSVALWAVNRVAKDEAATIRQLRRSAEALARAQTGGRTDARTLRAASDEFQERLDAVAKSATTVLERNRHAAAEETLRRIREIVRLAALQGGETWQRLEKGALLNEPTPGEDVLSMFQASTVTAEPARKPSKAEAQAEERRTKEAAQRQAEEDAQRAEQLEATARRLRAEVREAVAAADRAEQRAKAAEEDASRARAQARKSAKAAGK